MSRFALVTPYIIECKCGMKCKVQRPVIMMSCGQCGVSLSKQLQHGDVVINDDDKFSAVVDL